MAELHNLLPTDASNTDRFPEGQAPSTVNNGARALEGLVARWYFDTNYSVTSTLSGTVIQMTANRVSLTLTGTTSNYVADLLMAFTTGSVNVPGPCSININGIGPIALVDNTGISVSASAIPSGTRCLIYKDATSDKFRLLQPARALQASILGLGMTPANILDITQSQNAGSVINILNATNDTAAASIIRATSNGSNNIAIAMPSSNFTPSGAFVGGRGYLRTSASMAIIASGAITISVDGGTSNKASFDTSGNLNTPSGIVFPATQVASADANTLDDYEEGTFTPVLTFGGASVGITYSIQVGRYLKVGRVCTAQLYLLITNNGSSTGTLNITGLPFTSTGATNAYSAAAVQGSNFTGISGHLQAAVQPSTSLVYLQFLGTGTETSITDAHTSDSLGAVITVSYETA